MGPEETAFAYRDANWARSSPASTRTRPTSDAIGAWTAATEALHPYSAGGAYVNMMMDEGPRPRARELPRQLRAARQIKADYDPENLFRVNQNIPPAR